MMELREFTPAPPAPQMFGNAGREHMEKYGMLRVARCRARGELMRRRRDDSGADREDCGEEPQAFYEQPILAGAPTGLRVRL